MTRANTLQSIQPQQERRLVHWGGPQVMFFFVLIWHAKGDRSVYLSLHEHRKWLE